MYLKNKIKSLASPKYFYLLLIVVISTLIIFEVGFLLNKPNSKNSDVTTSFSLDNYASQVIELCATINYRPACYDKEIPKLMDVISMEDAFKVTSIIQKQDPSYSYCHVLGHELTAREVDKDPNKWKDVVARVPSGVCSNGGIHGVLQEKFRSETFTPEQTLAIKPDLIDLCEKRDSWNPTGLEQGSCYHALGHLTMYLTSAEIKDSIVLCDELGKKVDGRDYSSLCYDGAFMQIFQPLEPEDFELIAGKEVKSTQLVPYCSQFEGARRDSCWSEGWPLFYKEITTPLGLDKHCQNALLQSTYSHDRCYTSLFYVVAAQMRLDLEALKKFCPALVSERQAQCYANFASRLIETDYQNITKAVALCASASISLQDPCYEELIFYSTYNFHPGSDEFYSLCNSLPGEWKDKCLSRSI